KTMGDKVGGATRDLDGHAGGMKRVGDAADNSERNLIGIHDVIDGTATIMQGPGKAGIVAYVQGWADLAGGLAPLLLSMAEMNVKTIAQAATQKVAAAGTKVWAAAQWLMNTALFASPITWIIVGIIALVAVIVLIAKKTDWFSKAWGAAWGWIKKAASNVWEWLKKVPGWIGTAFSKVTSFITAPFKAAFNTVADAWNNTVGRLSWSVPSWVPVIGGNSISVPHLPHFHSGGVVPGAPGSEMLAVLQAGERVIPAGGRGGGEQWIRVDLGDLGDALLQPIAKAVSRRGGQVTHLGVRVVNGQVRA
ncbi:MAG TPA: hypothetical protein VGQ92_17925, partial [Actinoplanes sp.]|nr:hypothetical protein [Actinoplanes sp.]